MKSSYPWVYTHRAFKEINEKEAFVELLSQEYQEENKESEYINIMDEITIAAANQLRDDIDRLIMGNITRRTNVTKTHKTTR